MNRIIDSIEEKVGKLPKEYVDWVSIGVTADDRYSMYSLEWIDVSKILDVDIAPEGVQDGILPLAVFHSVALWCLDNKRGGRVILCPHDDIEASLYAPSVVGWLYRVCLEEASNFCDEDDIVQEQLKLWAQLIKPSRPDWSKHIVQLAEAEVTDYQSHFGVVTEQEVSKILEKEFGAEYINGYINFLLPED